MGWWHKEVKNEKGEYVEARDWDHQPIVLGDWGADFAIEVHEQVHSDYMMSWGRRPTKAEMQEFLDATMRSWERHDPRIEESLADYLDTNVQKMWQHLGYELVSSICCLHWQQIATHFPNESGCKLDFSAVDDGRKELWCYVSSIRKELDFLLSSKVEHSRKRKKYQGLVKEKMVAMYRDLNP